MNELNTITDRLQYVVDLFYKGNVLKFVEDNPKVSQSTLYRYLRGDKPSYEFLIEWNNIGFDVKWLLFGEGSITTTSNAGELKKIIIENEKQKYDTAYSKYLTNEPEKDYNNLPDASGTYTNLEGNNQ